MSIQRGQWLGPLFFGLLAPTAPLTAGQIPGEPVPIHGVTGTIALPANVDKTYSGVNTILVKTSDGIEHLIHVTKGTEEHEGAASLDSLQPGTAVVVDYTVKGIQTSAHEVDGTVPNGLKTNEGTLTKVDRNKKRITIKFADGATERLRLARHTAEDSDDHPRGGGRVVVYTLNESGRGAAHYFKPVR